MRTKRNTLRRSAWTAGDDSVAAHTVLRRSIALALCLSVCFAGPRWRTTAVHAAPAVAAPACRAIVPTPSNTSFPELRGASTGGQVWALFFFHFPARAKTDLKIVWHMTGSDPFRIRAHGPRGQVIRPIWGPEIHGGSNWNRPGGEWGTGWRFPRPGCWRFHATRGAVTGDIWLNVRPRV